MPNEGFFQRWSRLKTKPAAPDIVPAQPVVAPAPAAADMPATPAAAPPPTLADAAALNGESDYSAFVARDVDAAVRRLAMKKLFADPHFHQVDGLDIFMGDYNLPDPISPAMLAALDHARGTLARIEEVLQSAVGDAIAENPTIALEDAPAMPPPHPPNRNDDQEAA
jgi:hypothetical protein